MKKLSIDDMKYEKPDFNGSDLPKSQIISAWLIDWVKYALELAIADIGDFIPTKEELAKFLDVSPTTVQNAIRYAKNSGYFISKQSSGTSIADFYSKDLTSQDELNHGNICEYKIKKIIIDDKIPLNSTIPSVKDLSLMTNISQNTIRQALLNMTLSGYLEKQHLKGNKFCWIYKKELHLSHQEIVDFIQDENLTLTRQLIKKIKDYIEKTYKQGDKILPNQEFANMFD
ncbi:GntR family transcriptional regulator, partial [bacterium]|nr:GntR family transcriptional regulator [bacterium]